MTWTSGVVMVVEGPGQATLAHPGFWCSLPGSVTGSATQSRSRALFAGLGDPRAELTVLGRYLLSVIDEEVQILQIAARTPAGQFPRLDAAYAALVDGINAELADWIGTWAPTLVEHDRVVLAALGVNGILGARVPTSLLRQPGGRVPDDRYLAEWTALLACRIDALR